MVFGEGHCCYPNGAGTPTFAAEMDFALKCRHANTSAMPCKTAHAYMGKPSRQSPCGKCATITISGPPIDGASTDIKQLSPLKAPNVWPWLVASAAYDTKL